MPHVPSLDPQRTVDHVPAPGASSTIGGSTAQQTSALPADLPSIPGYAITGEIARGGMGVVYAGRDLTLERDVAIKTLLPGADGERFVVEAKITARLPHPGIPPLHALGKLEDGSPYLAMKLVQGRTLAELLKERPTPLNELPRFVQIFEQVAQAVGFAHSRGIIHRDLKPLNVMVGAFGEVQVMDWGLAKDLASRERERLEASSDGDEPQHTAAGSIIGTPGYMAPEQARGEGVDARADVFALGSILAAILTGNAAFVGSSRQDAIRKAASADLADVYQRLDACGSDAELIDLAKRCLVAKAKDRPADARTVATEVAAHRARVEARLRQAETERAEALVREVEQLKRRRVLLVAAGVIATVLAGGLVIVDQQRRHTAAERDAKDVALTAETKAREAEKQARDQAMAALRAMTDDVVENQLARSPGLSEESKAFLRKIIKHYEGFANITTDDAESRAIRAEGYARVGWMRFQLGEPKQAETALADSQVIYRRLVDDFPDNPDHRMGLVGVCNNLARLLQVTIRLQEAEATFAEAVALGRKLVEDFPERSEFRRQLATSLNNQAGLQCDLGHPRQGAAIWQDALIIYRQLAAEFPKRPQYVQDLARTSHNLGVILLQLDEVSKAEDAYTEALSARRRLAREYPKRVDLQQDLAHSLEAMGTLHVSRTGKFVEAEALFGEGLAIQRELVATYPARPDYRRQLANVHHNMGSLFSEMGRLADAETSLAEALAIRKELAATFSDQLEIRNQIAGTLVLDALNRNRRGDFVGAQDRLQEALPHHQAALEANPRHPMIRHYYRSNLMRLMECKAGLRERISVVRVARQLCDLGWNPPTDAYDAACVLATCIPIVEKTYARDADERRDDVQFYGAEAVKMLRDAVAKGFKDAAQVRKEPDLAPLREREDFQKLLAELEQERN